MATLDAPNAQRTQTVHRLARDLGFALCAITDAAPSAYAEHVRRWLSAGLHGTMQYLADHLELRLDPAGLLPGARSVIVVADRHPAAPDEQHEAAAGTDAPAGRIARYAWGDDYHRVIKKRLHALADALREQWPGHQLRVCVDTAPLLEREHGQRAGLGWIGKHTLLIHPQLGSWLLLGAVVTTLELMPDRDADFPDLPGPADHCGTCTRCIDACPTACIAPDGYSIDASRCISYLTIEHRAAIDPALHEAMGDWVAGCDVCQEVCPYNAAGRLAQLDAPPSPYRLRPPAPAIDLLELLDWDPQKRQEALVRSALKRIKLDMFKRNALIAAGNHLEQRDHPPLLARIRELAADADEGDLVRVTAKQVLERLREGRGIGVPRHATG